MIEHKDVRKYFVNLIFPGINGEMPIRCFTWKKNTSPDTVWANWVDTMEKFPEQFQIVVIENPESDDLELCYYLDVEKLLEENRGDYKEAVLKEIEESHIFEFKKVFIELYHTDAWYPAIDNIKEYFPTDRYLK